MVSFQHSVNKSFRSASPCPFPCWPLEGKGGGRGGEEVLPDLESQPWPDLHVRATFFRVFLHLIFLFLSYQAPVAFHLSLGSCPWGFQFSLQYLGSNTSPSPLFLPLTKTMTTLGVGIWPYLQPWGPSSYLSPSGWPLNQATHHLLTQRDNPDKGKVPSWAL